MNDRLGFTILLLAGGVAIIAFHALRRSYVSSSIYSALAAGVVCTILWTAMVRLNGIIIPFPWDNWQDWLILILYMGAMTLLALPAAFLLGIPFWMHRRRKGSL